MTRFEAMFECGDEGKRFPSWDVIEWEYQNNGVKVGKRVVSYPLDDEGMESAFRLAKRMNENYGMIAA